MDNDLREKFLLCGFPNILLDIEFDVRKYQPAVDYLKNFKQMMTPPFNNPEVKTGLYLHGKSDSGKSTIAVAIAKKLVEMKICVNGTLAVRHIFYVNYSTLIEEFYQIQRGEKKFENSKLDKSMKYHFLVLDDVGVETKLTDFLVSKFYLLINSRYEQRLPTLITSNFTLFNLMKRFENGLMSDRIYSRIEKISKEVHIKNSDWE